MPFDEFQEKLEEWTWNSRQERFLERYFVAAGISENCPGYDIRAQKAFVIAREGPAGRRDPQVRHQQIPRGLRQGQSTSLVSPFGQGTCVVLKFDTLLTIPRASGM